jgi:hypothetical protein
VFWVDALSSHSGEGPVAGKYEFTTSLIFHWFCPQQVAVDVMEDHDVLVAFTRHRGEHSSLISIHGCFDVVHHDQDIMFFDVGDDGLILSGDSASFVEQTPCRCPCMCPFCVSSNSGKNLMTFFYID